MHENADAVFHRVEITGGTSVEYVVHERLVVTVEPMLGAWHQRAVATILACTLASESALARWVLTRPGGSSTPQEGPMTTDV